MSILNSSIIAKLTKENIEYLIACCSQEQAIAGKKYFKDDDSKNEGYYTCLTDLIDELKLIAAAKVSVKLPVNYEQLCAQQALKIAQLEEAAKEDEKDWRFIYMQIYGIGGPLNDNKLGYAKEQFKPFHNIGCIADEKIRKKDQS